MQPFICGSGFVPNDANAHSTCDQLHPLYMAWRRRLLESQLRASAEAGAVVF
jgi:hypothetical protein